MAGSSASVTYEEENPVKKILIDWVSDDATGAVSVSTKKITGRIVRLVTDPGAAAPTAAYDVTLTDPEGLDVLKGLGADRSATVTEDVNIVYTGTSDHPYVNDVLALNITNAGNSKNGQVIIYTIGG